MRRTSDTARLAIVLSHPTQYYSPWFRWLAHHTDLKIKVFYLWDFGVTPRRDPQFVHTFAWDTDLLGGYEHEFVPNRARDPGTHHFRGLINPALNQRIAAWAPDAILLFGYKSVTHLRLVLWARRKRISLLFRGDSHLLGRNAFPWPARLVLTTLYRQFAAVLPVGLANSAYFDHLGVPRARQFTAPHCVDSSLFDRENTRHRDEAFNLRRRLGIPPNRILVLFAGKLIEKKQPLALLQAFIAIRQTGTALVFVGDGNQKNPLAQAAAGHDNVHFLPFANQTEMPARYLAADIFVLPSQGTAETWGLAVNEAMHMGVPCLVSNRVGCQLDLVRDGETGWVFDVDDPTALRTKLAEALAAVRAEDSRERIRSAVATTIARYTYATAARGLLDAIASLPEQRRPTIL